tara:strand:- start:3398 stop:4105 length:708 start_codon:yes stop_codon:yes gene_type:complete
MKKYTTIVFLILLAAALSSCTEEEQIGKVLKKKVSLVAEDGVSIAADFYPEDGDKAIILLHMYKHDKSSWESFAGDLRNKGYNLLAIDLRGHGESDLDLNSFTEQDYNNMVLDVSSGFDYLILSGMNQISVIGASIGANTALNFAVEELRVQNVILLSPGLDYRGIKTDETIKEYKRPLLIIAGTGDAYSWESSNTLFDLSPSKAKMQPYETTFHGTDIIDNFPESRGVVMEWLG